MEGWVDDGWAKEKKSKDGDKCWSGVLGQAKVGEKSRNFFAGSSLLIGGAPKSDGDQQTKCQWLRYGPALRQQLQHRVRGGHSSTRRAVPMGRQVRLGRCVRARAGGGERPGGSEGVCGWLAQVAKVDGSKSDFSLGGDDSRPPIITIVHQPRFIIGHKRSRQNNATMPLYDTTLSTLSNTLRYSSSDSSPDSSTSIASATVTSNPGSWSTPM